MNLVRQKLPGNFSLFDYIDILLYLFMVAQFIRFWVSPSPGDAQLIYYFAVLMGFEFILAHSGVFMAVMPLKLSIIIFIPVYGLFAIMFTGMVGDLSIIWIYLIIIFSRMRFAFLNVDEFEKKRMMGMSALTAILYFIIVMVIAICSNLIPEIGLTEDFLKESGYDEIKKTGGLLTDKPHVSMFFGAIYYFLIALFEFLLPKSKQTVNITESAS